MRTIWRHLAGALLLAGLLATTSPARAVQGSSCLPTSGTYTGVQFATFINAGLASLISSNSGATAPKTDCSSAPVLGQVWLNTNAAIPLFEIYDGASWLVTAAIDPVNHIWEPPIGGGLVQLPSAAPSGVSPTTVDLCATAASTITITGTTSVVGFGASCAPGQVKLVEFSGTLALVHNPASLLLPGGVTIATQPGDQAIAKYTGGGIWRVVSYQRADGTAVTATVVPPVHYAGQVILLRGTTCPAGSVLEDGSALSRATYAQLFAALGTAWGTGDGSTTFNIPDSRGLFDRGWGSGQSVDSGRVFGSAQLDQLQAHSHTQYYPVAGYSSAANGPNNFVNSLGTTTTGGFGVSGSARSGSETRPVNITVLHCLFTANSP